MDVVVPWSESQLTHRPKLAVTGHRLIHFFINCLVWCPLVLVGRTTNRQECSISMSHKLLWKCCHPCACIVLLLLHSSSKDNAGSQVAARSAWRGVR